MVIIYTSYIRIKGIHKDSETNFRQKNREEKNHYIFLEVILNVF